MATENLVNSSFTYLEIDPSTINDSAETKKKRKRITHFVTIFLCVSLVLTISFSIYLLQHSIRNYNKFLGCPTDQVECSNNYVPHLCSEANCTQNLCVDAKLVCNKGIYGDADSILIALLCLFGGSLGICTIASYLHEFLLKTFAGVQHYRDTLTEQD
jgi:hypothetical protein